MKAIFCLALVATSLLAFTSAQVSETTPNFVLGTWYTTNETEPVDLSYSNCCMPNGTITISSNKSSDFPLLSATSWAGNLCAQLSLDNTSQVEIPFFQNSTYTQLNQSAEALNVNNIGFHFSRLNLSRPTGNSTQGVFVKLGLDFSSIPNAPIHNATCGIVVSKKSATIMKAIGAGFIALGALLFI